ncbi:MAG: squalene/phytoene synthase family protein [Candidatus Eisenbacteria bacterium]|nr:squalene/phytoene synthase family protein [Candidatus Eisenbacteria bacterium]
MADLPPPAEAREYCRRTLPRVSRTFALNIELLSGSFRESVRVAYLLCRAADTIEDRWAGSAGEIGDRFADFDAALAGDGGAAARLAAAVRGGSAPLEADFELLAHLPLVLRAFGLLEAGDREAIAEGVGILSAGMRRYAARAARRGPGVCYLDDEAELREYCWIVAGCVGAMLTKLYERRAGPDRDAALGERRRRLAPRVGEALQLTNILLDWPNDVRRGRCYLPSAWLAPFGLSPGDLAGGDAPAARELALRLEALAHAALDQVADYLDTVPPRHVRYRLFCLWPALWARASLHLAHADPDFPLRGRPKLTRARLWSVAARSLLVLHSRAGTRRLLARA